MADPRRLAEAVPTLPEGPPVESEERAGQLIRRGAQTYLGNSAAPPETIEPRVNANVALREVAEGWDILVGNTRKPTAHGLLRALWTRVFKAEPWLTSAPAFTSSSRKTAIKICPLMRS